MKYLSSGFLLLSISAVSGCTVLGAVSDMVLADASSDSGTRDSSSNRKGSGLEFTKLGAEIDAAIIGGLVDEYKKSQESTSAQAVETEESEVVEPLIPPRSTFVGLCTKKLDKDEPCYTPDYYNQFRAQLAEKE